ncbi:DUF86 domain-containing protein [Desertifilum sp. FACHB-1129]|uniref:DUF86 domain-containing protein n=2 Tax=Desertifilum tharense IPPAS B-1220 TaxID=1781255 RepID=A0A1E5QEB9_9CYAN|nr:MULTISPECIES: DUF86 domain-containing protein [Desertifilum]MDA0211449.1 DUF86 domain-containing protein [Cyanobacteria bacterium FC1]MBD2313503.1 DUF86 domain-containing protein [Desertifilum sp. FACHB-1129]MBD2323835.1 DUF86 domain-containing protein [Desertifilum sp. FACHB-866]MBD2333680.1 DUF86 domain-containing protein [Desertifilum sp. FACHB-868]OEJ72934.1 hypothetical protein BH720_22370 [Desertifilum tharense IPPAS B-1220]
MQPRELHYLLDMLNAAKLAQDFVAGISWETFQTDLMRQAAVTRQIEIIGEAARRISEATQAELPDIPWRALIGMRNRIVHEYDRLNLEIIWNATQASIPQLIAVVEPLIPPEEP